MPNHDEPTANESPNETANKPEPFGVAFGERAVQQWRSVQQIAEVEGIGERAIQKRCQRGYYVARLTEGDKGEVWEIDANSIKTTANARANRSANEGEPSASHSPNRSANDDEPQGERKGSSADVIPAADDKRADRHEVELLRVQLDSARAEATREREFSELLKSQLEAVTQSEAQTKAALREALKAMPKALPVATDATAQAMPHGTPPAAQGRAPIASTPDAATTTPDAVKSPAQTTKGAAPMKEPRPLWKLILGIR
jgi:hypothetical protein